ncbi:MAG: hypothetical protein Q4B78_02135, partial [Bacillota bacterium]|nr:hypothetical protein [Bacillota bacterium]
MISYILPLAAVVLGNVAYQICAKSVPASLDPFASLTVTYLTAAAASFVIYSIFNRGENIIMELHKLNPTPFIFGAVLVILEGGFIYAYKVGWQVSILTIVQSSFVAVGLI